MLDVLSRRLARCGGARFFFARLVRAFLAPRVGASSASSSSDSWLSRVCRRGTTPRRSSGSRASAETLVVRASRRACWGRRRTGTSKVSSSSDRVRTTSPGRRECRPRALFYEMDDRRAPRNVSQVFKRNAAHRRRERGRRFHASHEAPPGRRAGRRDRISSSPFRRPLTMRSIALLSVAERGLRPAHQPGAEAAGPQQRVGSAAAGGAAPSSASSSGASRVRQHAADARQTGWRRSMRTRMARISSRRSRSSSRRRGASSSPTSSSRRTMRRRCRAIKALGKLIADNVLRRARGHPQDGRPGVQDACRATSKRRRAWSSSRSTRWC